MNPPSILCTWPVQTGIFFNGRTHENLRDRQRLPWLGLNKQKMKRAGTQIHKMYYLRDPAVRWWRLGQQDAQAQKLHTTNKNVRTNSMHGLKTNMRVECLVGGYIRREGCRKAKR